MRQSFVVGSIVSAVVVAGIVAVTILGSPENVSDTRQEAADGAGGKTPARATEPPAATPELPPMPPAPSQQRAAEIPEPPIPNPWLPGSPRSPAGESREPAFVPADTVDLSELERLPQNGPAPRAAIDALEKEALDAVHQLIEALPGKSDPLALMGMVQVMFGDTAEGIKWWERCLKVNPRRPDVYDGLARIAAEKGDYEKAVELWGKVLQIDSSLPGIRNKLGRALIDLGKTDEAIAVLEKEIEVSPGEKSLSYFLLGKAYLQLRKFEKAQECYKSTLAIQSDDSRAWYGLATVQARLGHSEEARKSMEKFRAARVGDLEADSTRRRTEHDLTSVRELVAMTHLSVGTTYQARKYMCRAEHHWRRAAELGPKDIASRMQLAVLYRGRGDFEKALPICRQLVEIDPANAAFHLNLGIIYAKMNRIDAALVEVKRAIDIDPNHAESRRIYQQLQETKQRDRQK